MNIFNFTNTKSKEIPTFDNIESLVEFLKLESLDSSKYEIEFYWKRPINTYNMSKEDKNKFFSELYENFNEQKTGFYLDTKWSSYSLVPLTIRFRRLTYWVYFENDIPVHFESGGSGTDTPAHLARTFPSIIPVKWDRYEKISF